ncbi:MAG TPA: hemerythrin domain-containing protein [Polyangiaceae bacterium]|nr:hemerythrin domain-containing protein [Polyangiaceae bacterium]
MELFKQGLFLVSQSPTSDPPSLRDRCAASHGRIEAALSSALEAVEAGDCDRLSTLWREFAQRFTCQMQEEDDIFIPALVSGQPRDARALVEEHRHLRARVAEISVAVQREKVRPETLRALAQELRAHAAHEQVALDRRTEPG